MESNLLFSSIVPALCPQSLQSIESFGFKQMTPVQRATIPLFMSNKDVCVEATTGSGKTLAFVIPVCEILNKRSTPLKKHEVGAMVVGPTRSVSQSAARKPMHL